MYNVNDNEQVVAVSVVIGVTAVIGMFVLMECSTQQMQHRADCIRRADNVEQAKLCQEIGP